MARPWKGRTLRHTDGHVTDTRTDTHAQWTAVETCAHSLLGQALIAYQSREFVTARTLYTATVDMLRECAPRFDRDSADEHAFDLYIQSALIGARAMSGLIG